MYYTFSIKRDIFTILEIVIDQEVVKENLYLQSLIEKCFEKVFQTITKDNNSRDEDSSEEIDLEERDD